jgi:hypothetical protein
MLSALLIQVVKETPMKFIFKILKLVVLIIPFCLTVVYKILVVIGIIRLQFGMSEKLDVDLSYSVSGGARYLNQFWDVVMGKTDQPHHTPIGLFFAATRNSLNVLVLLFLSIFSWRR